jgi:hypothetical protein
MRTSRRSLVTVDVNRRRTAVIAAAAAILAVAVTIALVVPDTADAGLRAAAGGDGGGAGGFARFVRFINRLADYVVPVGGAFSVLGLIWGGILFMTGDARAGRVLGFVALGVGVVLLAKPVAA